ncbi:hypothetical protein HYD_2400 [Candidatus Hydrogenosomobacter endosymbioticus]|uniref:Uncharacterized protein n=1 Tax=Candidatus Hydrogenosomobacter endosymbioticus TaxID=2558174 RepID=A0ABM7V8J4_9PROT|nr:hypothetical protein HYD_2400 [Candidatus Hydrogenosomobacter endosymbioticus]
MLQYEPRDEITETETQTMTKAAAGFFSVARDIYSNPAHMHNTKYSQFVSTHAIEAGSKQTILKAS